MSFSCFSSAYKHLALTVRDRGVDAAPRGKAVTELRWPHMWHIQNPNRWNLMIPGRKYNIFFALAEVIWMWSGKGGADFITFYNKSIAQFLDGPIPYFHGAYGRRTRAFGYDEHPWRPTPSLRTQPGGATGSVAVTVDQLSHVISKIRQDPHTRQAVVSLWDPVKDNWIQSNDHPCNNLLYFQHRDGSLNMTVVRRSNDLILGVPYNMCQFAHLHALMAGALGYQVGHYSVMANNLHFYHDLYPEILELVEEWATNSDSSVLEAQYTDIDWVMEWDLNKFTYFVNTVWEPFEKISRAFIDEPNGRNADVFYEMQRHMMSTQFEVHEVPEYWRHVFNMLMAYHVMKGSSVDVFKDMFKQFPWHFQWHIMDFWNKTTTVLKLREEYAYVLNQVRND